MAEGHRMTAAELVDNLMADEHADVLRDSVAWLVAQLMEAEVGALTGAGLGERAPDRRQAQRNGYRPRRWDTRVGELELAIPRLRTGSYFPSFLEPRRRAEQALVAVVQEAYVNGISTRKVDRLVEQLGLQGMTKDQVSRLCRGLDEQGQRVPGAATGRCLPVPVAGRQGGAGPGAGRGAPQGAGDRLRRAPGRPPGGGRHRRRGGRDRSVLARLPAVAAGSRAGWGAAGHLRRPHRPPHRHRQGLGCPWQRCTVHFLRDMLGHVPRARQPLVSGAIRQVFTAASAAEARQRLGQVADQLRPHAAKVARLLEDAEADLLAFYEFPAEHWSKLRSTNPLERVNREIGRRTDVVGIFPNDAALLRLAGMLLVEQNDEWLVGRRYLSEASMALVLAAATDHDPAREEVLELTAS
jgi:putative transposase